MIPFLGALTLSLGTIAEKLVLRKKKISVKLYQLVVFVAIIISMIPFVFFNWYISPEFYYVWSNYLLLGGVVFFSVLANYFAFSAMKGSNLVKIESARITEPLFVIILVFVLSFFVHGEYYEKNYSVLIPALIAGLALIFSHFKRDHLEFSKYYLYALLGSFFFAVELVISRAILDHFNPITFYFIRCVLILIAYLIFFRPKNLDGLDARLNLEIFGTGLLWVFYRLIVYIGYKSLGIAETTLTLMLGPVLVYLFAWKFLKNKITWRNIVSGAIILLCVLYAIFV